MRPQYWDSIAIAITYRNTTSPWSAIPSRLRTPGIVGGSATWFGARWNSDILCNTMWCGGAR